MPHVTLTSADWTRIKGALKGAFSTVKELDGFTHTRFSALGSVDLHSLVRWQDNMDTALEDLLRGASAAGRLPELLDAVAEARPHRPDLRELADDIRAQPATTPSAISSRGRGDHYAHIDLPDILVPRPELLAEVLGLLTADDTLLALHGMGGIGKTVLARVLCDDPDTQAAFADGILWAEIGKDADETRVRSRLTDWIRELGGVITETAPSLDSLKAMLAGLLRERACLLILDDVWSKEHVTALDRGGPDCRVLLTTRDAALVEDLGGRPHPVPMMTEAEAVTLLEEWAGDRVQAAPVELKRRVVARLGQLPLAIKLAGAQLRRTDPESWLASFDATRLASRRPEGVHDSLAATFRLSLDELDPADRAAYTSLAIFKADEPVPAGAVVKLWAGLDHRPPADALALLDDLAARALLRGASAGYAGDRVSIDSLLRDFMAAEQGADGLLAAHRALLAAYSATQRGAGWPSAPDDGYLYDHLAYHLEKAAPEEFPALFADRTWLVARLERHLREADRYLYDGYLADLSIAWDRSEAVAGEQLTPDVEPTALAECARYALIRASVNALAEGYPPELIARAVELGHWPARRALSVTGRVPDESQRSKGYALLLRLPGLTPPEREEAARHGLAAAQRIIGEWPRSDALAQLAQRLSGELVTQALDAARDIKHVPAQARALTALAPVLDEAQRAEALGQAWAAALDTRWGHWRAEAVAALAPFSDQEQRAGAVAQALDAALALEDSEEVEATALAALAPHLSDAQIAAALAAAMGLSEVLYQAQALAGLVPRLSDAQIAAALPQALATALMSEDEFARAEALGHLAPHLAGDLLAQALAAARALERNGRRAEVLAALAPQLDEAQRADALAEGLAAALAAEDEWQRSSALAALAPHLSGELLEQAVTAALAMFWAGNRTEALAALAPRLPRDLLAKVLTKTLVLRDALPQAEALLALAPQLSGDHRIRSLAQGTVAMLDDPKALSDVDRSLIDGVARSVAQALDDDPELAYARSDAAKFVADVGEALVSQARREELVGVEAQRLAEAIAIQDQDARAAELAKLLPYLSPEMLTQGLAAALTLEHEGLRAGALADLAPQLSGDLLTQGLAIALAIEQEQFRARALVALAPQLTGDSLVEGLDEAVALDDEFGRAEALAAFAPQLSGDLLARGLDAALAIESEHYRTTALAGFAPQLSGELLALALADTLRMKEEEPKANTLAALAPRLSGDQLAQELTAALALEDAGYRAYVLAALAPKLGGALLNQGLAAALAIDDEWSQAQALSAFARNGVDPYRTIPLVRQAILANLRHNLAWGARSELLTFYAYEESLRPPILTSATLAAIANHIIDICAWEWL